ncbi:GIY-YIG nuclease family protein [bacterium]|nr:MAG: GIY-YIG nuclease family protein [bacterium]
MYYVYIVRSMKDDKHYIGYTNNIERRLQEHNRGKSKSVKHRGPFELVYHEGYVAKIEAVRREKQIKSYKGGEVFRKLLASTLSSSLV